MTLPKIDVPIYNFKLPSSEKEISARPFLVKEEKLLLMAAESKDVMEVIKTTQQVINNCIIDDNIDVFKTPFFDIDYLIIALRAKSIGEKIEVMYNCNAIVDGTTCGNSFNAIFDISNCSIDKSKNISDEIKIENSKGIKLKYPSYAAMKIIAEDDLAINKKIRIIANCIDCIYDSEQIYSSKDYTKEDMYEFIENLTESTFKKLENYIDNLPSFHIHTKATCDKCGFEHTLRYTDFERFFT